MQMGQHVEPKIFLSYTRQDAEIARRLVDELRSRGADVFLDADRIAPGANIRDRITTAIRESDLFLLLVTPAAAQSEWVRQELTIALATNHRARVVPVRIEQAEIPADLTDVLYLDADTENLGLAAEQILRQPTPVGGEGLAARRIEQVLTELELEWLREPSIAGVRPDFLAETADGRRLIVELKDRPNPSFLDAVDARSQADYLRALIGADAAVAVVPEIDDFKPPPGIVSLSGLSSYLRDFLASPMKPPEPSAPRPEPAPSDEKKIVFASMPFKPQYEDVYWVAMTAAAEAVGATCVRVDRDDFDGDVPAKIREYIESSIAVIADLSGSSPDVLFEVGYARRHGCPCVQISSTPHEDLPFNVRNISTLAYKPGQVTGLREPLIKRLKGVLDSR